MAMSSLVWAIVALFLPPLPVAIRKGCSGHLILNIVFLLLAWIPAVLHAWYVILEYDSKGQKKMERRIKRARDEQRVESLKRESVQDEKAPVQFGNQQGWYAPTPPTQGIQQPQTMQQPQMIPAPQTMNQSPASYPADVKY